MAVSFSAKVTKDGATLALNRLTGNGGGGGAGSVRAGMSPISGPNIVEVVGKGMVLNFLPRVFDTNMYNWPAVDRGGHPLLRSQRQVSRIRSAFYYSVAGAVATITNIYKYAHIHDKGATIEAKNERTVVQNCTSKKGKKFTRTLKVKMLAFKTKDGWAFAKSVTIPQRRFAYWSEQASAFALNRARGVIRKALGRSE